MHALQHFGMAVAIASPSQVASLACRLALHVTTSNKPLKKSDVKAALGMKDSQGRRRLLSSVAGASLYDLDKLHML